MVHILLKPGLEILSITLLACEMSAIVRLFERSLALPFFGIGMKMDISSSVAAAEFSKFAGILSAALSQHHLLGFEIAHLEFYGIEAITMSKAHILLQSFFFSLKPDSSLR